METKAFRVSAYPLFVHRPILDRYHTSVETIHYRAASTIGRFLKGHQLGPYATLDVLASALSKQRIWL